jgi:hypothetical protein
MQRRLSFLIGSLSLLLVLFLCPNVVRGQNLTGSLYGVVRDASQAVVAGAHVVAANVDTNYSKETTTDAGGEYRILTMPPGMYKITATAAGFQETSVTGIDLRINDQLRQDVTLSVGGVQTEVSVEANAIQVNTENSQVGDVIETQKMLSIPLNGRSYLDLLGLQAGVLPFSVTTGTDRPVSGGIARPGNVSVNGQAESSNGFYVNGGDVNENKNEGAGLLPNLDSVAEFRLITSSMNAEYGKAIGAVMNAITKSGTNSFHGAAFEFLRNSDMDARGFFDPTLAALHRNQFGYAVGGPFPKLKNKLFWFTDYQGTRQVQGASTGLMTLPTAAQRAGNFSPSQLSGKVNGAYFAQYLSQELGYTVTNGEAYTSVFPGGVIPQRAFDKVSVNYLAKGYIPQPNLDPVNGYYADASQKGTATDDKAGQRVDFYNNKTGTWSFYYHFDDSLVFNPLVNGGSSVPGTPDSVPQRAQMFVVSNTKTISATTVNEIRLSVFRTSLQTAVPDKAAYAHPSDLGFTTGVGSLGIVNSAGVPNYPDTVPTVQFNNFTIGEGLTNMYQANNSYYTTEGLSKIVGSHSFKMGGDFRYYQQNVRNVCGPTGYFYFNGVETGNDIADFLIGAPSQYVQCSLQLLNTRANYGGVYIQDSWKVKPNLTFNLGIRWEVNQPWTDHEGMFETTVPGRQSTLFPTAPVGLLVPGDPGVPSSVSPTQWHPFAPRAGVAYAPNYTGGFLGKLFGGPGKSSIRAAFGIYYLGGPDANFGVIGDAPYGLYWSSPAPPFFDTPFMTRSNGASQGVHYPFTYPVKGQTANLNFVQYYPLLSPGFYVHNKLTSINQYNFSFQRALSQRTVLTLAYVGNQGHRLPASYPYILGDPWLCLNLIALGSTPACGRSAESSTFNLPAGMKYTGPNTQYNGYGTIYSSITGTTNPPINNQQEGIRDGGTVAWTNSALTTNMANSHYNSFQATVERKAADVTFLAAYTFSKAIAQANQMRLCSYDVTKPVYCNTSAGLLPWTLQLTNRLAATDLTQNFVLSGTWSIPFDRAFSAAPRRLTQGWGMTGVMHAYTGLPITLSDSGDRSLQVSGDLPNCVGPVVSQNPRLAANGRPNMFIVPTGAFTQETVGLLGNCNPVFLHGPAAYNVDYGLAKTIRINEARSILIRGEFFNLFNHPQFSNPAANLNNSNFGEVTSVRATSGGGTGGRVGQVSAKFIW